MPHDARVDKRTGFDQQGSFDERLHQLVAVYPAGASLEAPPISAEIARKAAALLVELARRKFASKGHSPEAGSIKFDDGPYVFTPNVVATCTSSAVRSSNTGIRWSG
jgi:hypothetical protein